MRTITKIESSMKQPAKRKRVAAYARVSSGKDMALHSLSAQISYYNSYIGSRGDWELAGIYADEALSGTKDSRPEFQRMLADCRAGKIDMVITKSITRLARNTLTLLEAVRELKELDIDVFFEKENIHTLGSDGELMLTLLASFAQEESRSASENKKWSIRRMFEQGLPYTCSMLGYRIKNGTLKIVPEEADVVRMIFSDYLSGMGRNAIAKKLTRMGVPTKRGGQWRPGVVGNILRNEKYAGDMRLQKYYSLDHISKKDVVNHGERPMYYVEDSHEAIIDKETFAKVQEEIRRRSKKYPQGKPPRGPYLFTSLVRCGLCGKNYQKWRSNGGTKYASTVWICPTYNRLGKEGCPSKRIPESVLVEKTSEVLGTEEWDRDTLLGRVARIDVPEQGKLVYVFHDGGAREVAWKFPVRRQPEWTDNMRQAARERIAKINERRKNSNAGEKSDED